MSPVDSRIFFVQGQYNQNIIYQHPDPLPYAIYNHDANTAREVLSRLPELTGLDIPEGYFSGTAVYNVPGLLYHMGMRVDLRVLRQQIFLGGSPRPLSVNDTESMLFHCIGNTLWNYMDSRLWTGNLQVKNEYRELRGIKIYKAITPARNNGVHRQNQKQQHNLFYIASEDFRYSFGTAMAGRGEWHLDKGPTPVAPPSPDVINFWRREVQRNAYSIPSAEAQVATSDA